MWGTETTEAKWLAQGPLLAVEEAASTPFQFWLSILLIFYFQLYTQVKKLQFPPFTNMPDWSLKKKYMFYHKINDSLCYKAETNTLL